MPDLVTIRRALISVSDKTDLIPFATALAVRGVEIISTGGTAKALEAAGVRVKHVEALTGFPEGLDGRVKTLHPAVHSGLLALRDKPEHESFMKAHNFGPIDLVCINLYPFERTVSDPGVTMDHAIENIDIGGPAMLRAAAKNHQWVTVVTSPARYDRVITELRNNTGATTMALRAELAAAAFARVAEYDAAIASFLSRRAPRAFPQVLRLGYTKADELRYGENPHQDAALYRDPSSTGPTVVNARQLHGKPMSYNNVLDAAAALEVAKSLRKLGGEAGPLRGSGLDVAAVVVKHTNPCGAACAGSIAAAVDSAIAGDAVAAYGGILAVSRPVDVAGAKRIADEKNFFEIVVAPDYDAEALTILKDRWVHARLLAVGDRAASTARKLEFRSVPGGLLVQDRDTRTAAPEQWTHAAGPAPTDEQLAAAAMLEMVCKYASSNAVVIGGWERASERRLRLFGLGCGQVDRVTACRLAIQKAAERARGAVALGDAFFPFPDGPRDLIDAGVSMIVHPGGSKRDAETFDLCRERGVTCMTTGTRHFRH